MFNYSSVILPITLIVAGCAHAESAKWLEDSSTVHATAVKTPTVVEKSNAGSTNTNRNPIVKLATGQEATLIGGVYVKSTSTANVIAWAQANNYVAREDQWIDGAVNIETTPQQAIKVANAIASIEGVTTAAPRYRVKKVLK